MRNLTAVTTIFCLLTFLGCRKAPTEQSGADELYTPYLTSVRDNGKVTLKWRRPICAGFSDCPQLEPNHFEILMSNTSPQALMVHPKVHATVSNNIFEVTINNLTNGKPYYFAIRAIRHKHFTISNSIMTIPDKPENVQAMFQTIDKSKEFGTWSPNQLSISYVSNYYWNNGKNGSQSVLINSLSNNTEWLVEKSSSSPEWSPTEQKIVYHTDNGHVNTSPGYRPTHISVYNIQDSTIKRLTDGNSINFMPTWSPDGNWIAFLSDKAGSKEYNIWKVPSDSGTVIQVTHDLNNMNDLENINARSSSILSWSKDGNNIAFSATTKLNQKYITDIYTVPSTGGGKTVLISSQWEDCLPAYSPDGTTIAFVSNRSGVNEIWTMNLQTKQLKQITSSSEKWVYTYPGKIEWSASGNKILFTSTSNHFRALYTVDID